MDCGLRQEVVEGYFEQTGANILLRHVPIETRSQVKLNAFNLREVFSMDFPSDASAVDS